MSCEVNTATTLREAGQKVTPQRMIILSILRHANDHVTASQVLTKARQTYPYVDASTVYRTLAAAKDLHLATETNLGHSENQFEWVGRDRHHHMICRGCGFVASLDNSYLDGLASALLQDYAFQADLDHFALFGLCEGCRRQ